MSTTAPTAETTAPTTPKKEHPWWAIPTILAILMLSSGGMFVLIAWGNSILASAG